MKIEEQLPEREKDDGKGKRGGKGKRYDPRRSMHTRKCHIDTRQSVEIIMQCDYIIVIVTNNLSYEIQKKRFYRTDQDPVELRALDGSPSSMSWKKSVVKQSMQS